MWSAIFELIVLLLVAGFVWRFVTRVIGIPRRPAEPEDRADYADIHAPLRPRPHSNAGAVALAEPDEDSDEP